MDADFNGSLDDFQAMMLSLQSQYCAVWTSTTGDRLRFNRWAQTEHVDLTLYVPWFVSLVDGDGEPTGPTAMIQAFKRGEKAAVFFRDGYIYNSGGLGAMVNRLGQERAIGPAFEQFVQEILQKMNAWAPPPRVPQAPGDPTPARDPGDGHFAYPANKRREIVRHYRADRCKGIIANKDHWARYNYSICAKTLKRYEDEFPAEPRRTPTDT